MAKAEVDARATGDEGGGSFAEDGQPAAAKGGATISVTVVLLALLVASVAAFLTSSLARAGDGDGVGKGVQERAAGRAGEAAGKRAEPVEHAVGDGVGIPGFNSQAGRVPHLGGADVDEAPAAALRRATVCHV